MSAFQASYLGNRYPGLAAWAIECRPVGPEQDHRRCVSRISARWACRIIAGLLPGVDIGIFCHFVLPARLKMRIRPSSGLRTRREYRLDRITEVRTDML